jgi:polyphenol oxidase
MPEPIDWPLDVPEGTLVAVSSRGVAPPGTPSPTDLFARRLTAALGVADLPIVRATQVHGARVVTVEETPAAGEVADAGACDALVTRLPGVGLVVQTADCVPLLLAGRDVVGAVHAGWRGAAANVAGAAAETLLSLTGDPGSVRAWLGPSIGACCYEVGGEVAERFADRFRHRSERGRFLLDLPAVVRSQLDAAGIAPGNVATHPSCTMCGGEHFASWRRDRKKAGRMVALVARYDPIPPR